MAKIERFEDLEAWKSARELARKIYEISGKGSFGKDFDLRSQMRRAAVSVSSNIAEGFERGGNRELLQFLSQAKGSVGEVRSQLYNAKDFGYLNEEQFQQLHEECMLVGRLIAGFQRYLQESEKRGTKYRLRQP